MILTYLFRFWFKLSSLVLDLFIQKVYYSYWKIVTLQATDLHRGYSYLSLGIGGGWIIRHFSNI